MNRFPAFHGPLLLGVMLGVISLAVAHHGNPQAPTPPWYGYLPPGSSQPLSPALPGR